MTPRPIGQLNGWLSYGCVLVCVVDLLGLAGADEMQWTGIGMAGIMLVSGIVWNTMWGVIWGFESLARDRRQKRDREL